MTGAHPGDILILGLNYAPEEIGIGRYTTGLAEGLAGKGWQVSVIAGQPYYPRWRRYAGAARGWTIATENGVRVTRCPHYIPGRPTAAKRILHLASFALAALPVALCWAIGRETKRPGIVLCIVPALFAAPVAWVASRLRGAKLAIHIQDFEIEAAFASGVIANGSLAGLLRKLALRLERILLRRADQVSTISPQMGASLIAKGAPPELVKELRNWADNAISPDPSRGHSYRRQWELDDRKIALYSGNLANKQGLEILAEAAELLKDRADILILVCGEGAGRPKLEALATACPNLLIKDLQPSSRMQELLGLAEVHLLPQLADAADLVLPSKLVNMLASGRPVIATALPGTGLHDEVEDCGLCVPPGDAAAMAKSVIRLIDDSVYSAELGAKARSRAIARWSESRILDTFAASFQALIDRDMTIAPPPP